MERRERRTGAEQLVPSAVFDTSSTIVRNLRGHVGEAEAIILAVEISEKCGHRTFLVLWNLKVVRGTATGEARRDLGVVLSASDASDPGACESTRAGVMSDLLHLRLRTMSHTYRTRGTREETGLCPNRHWSCRRHGRRQRSRSM